MCVNKKTHRGRGEAPTSVGRPHPHLGSVYKLVCEVDKIIRVFRGVLLRPCGMSV